MPRIKEDTNFFKFRFEISERFESLFFLFHNIALLHFFLLNAIYSVHMHDMGHIYVYMCNKKIQ